MITATFLLSAFSLILVGVFGMLTRKNIIRILLAVNILETGVNLLLVSFGYFPGGKAPIITTPISATNLPFVDPLPQALVLTSIVIGLGTTALALAITLRYYRRRRTLEFDGDAEDGVGIEETGSLAGESNGSTPVAAGADRLPASSRAAVREPEGAKERSK